MNDLEDSIIVVVEGGGPGEHYPNQYQYPHHNPNPMSHPRPAPASAAPASLSGEAFIDETAWNPNCRTCLDFLFFDLLYLRIFSILALLLSLEIIAHCSFPYHYVTSVYGRPNIVAGTGNHRFGCWWGGVPLLFVGVIGLVVKDRKGLVALCCIVVSSIIVSASASLTDGGGYLWLRDLVACRSFLGGDYNEDSYPQRYSNSTLMRMNSCYLAQLNSSYSCSCYKDGPDMADQCIYAHVRDPKTCAYLVDDHEYPGILGICSASNGAATGFGVAMLVLIVYYMTMHEFQILKREPIRVEQEELEDDEWSRTSM